MYKSTHMTMQLLVDADACPVKDEAVRVAGRYQRKVIFVSNQGIRPNPAPNVSYIVVGAQFDAADDWIVEHANPGDIVVTADIQLAGRCLAKGCMALNPAGHVFTQKNIGSALSMRALSAHLRETGESKGHNPSFSKKDRSEFLQSLDRLMQKA